MKARKIRSIRRASFLAMLSGSLVLVLINFLVLSCFVVITAFLLISSEEKNLSQILINNLNEKQERIKNVSMYLANVIENNSSESEKKLLLENSISNNQDIRGILILDDKGIITDASKDYEEYIGIDSSGKDYYSKIKDSKAKDTIISDAYVSNKINKLSISIVSPIIKDNVLSGMVVALVNPDIIENSKLVGLNYYLVDLNGNIIFQSYEGNFLKKEENIKDTLLMKKGISATHAFLYRDKVSGSLVLGSISEEPKSHLNIVVQYHIFANTQLFKALIIMLVLVAMFVIAIVLIFSVQISSIITKYIDIFKNQVKKIAAGSHDIKLLESYPHEEINEIMGIFNSMSQKIKQREEELQAYNEELIAANAEIKSMLSKLNKNEKEKREQYLQIIWTMVNLLEIKDEYTAGHSKSVIYYAEEISEKLNESYGFGLDVESIQVAAMLHDIGKIGIDRKILNKPAKLTKEEFEIIKTHSSKGYYALRDIDSLKEERKIIKYHHERYDGMGYPEGLGGDSIPLGARIICVADAFDAMVSDRPYRSGMPLEMAVGELVSNKGRQFDPLIVDVFISMLREGQFESVQAQVH